MGAWGTDALDVPFFCCAQGKEGPMLHAGSILAVILGKAVEV